MLGLNLFSIYVSVSGLPLFFLLLLLAREISFKPIRLMSSVFLLSEMEVCTVFTLTDELGDYKCRQLQLVLLLLLLLRVLLTLHISMWYIRMLH